MLPHFKGDPSCLGFYLPNFFENRELSISPHLDDVTLFLYFPWPLDTIVSAMM